MAHRMKKQAAVFVILMLAATAPPAMTINPGGTGQVLIYPYYTVNKHQQTIFSVGNPTSAGKAVQVTFREAYNGKIVYAVEVFLPPHATWSANVFAPEDAGKQGSGAAILSNETACTNPLVYTPPAAPTPGFAYTYFSNQNYLGGSDGGPSNDARQREGFIEAIEMAEIQGDTLNAISPYAFAIDCSKLPPAAAANPADFTAPTGGLTGGAAVIDVPQGTYFAFEPRAIDGFRTQAVLPPRIVQLTDAGDATSATISSSINYQGSYLTLTFPLARALDAVSVLFMADTIYGDIDQSPEIGAATDWVLTFPTKTFYVNMPLSASGPGPFEHLFGRDGPGSAVTATYDVVFHNGNSQGGNWCGFNECPPIGPTIQYQTQVITFLGTLDPPSAVLGSAVVTPAPAGGYPASAVFSFGNPLNASNEGYVLTGLPVIGVQAINYVNSNVTAGVLSNYSGSAALRTTVSCMRNDAACP